jgi:hypothetical protein
MELEFEVYQSKNFEQPMTAGVSLFLYRIVFNGSWRTPTGRIGPGGKRNRTRLPLDLNFLLTVWGEDASLQHSLAGWMMRVLEDMPLLPATLLNTSIADVFKPDETVEVGLVDLKTEDMFRIWETFIQSKYQLSIPYVAKSLLIESSLTKTEGPPVQERVFRHGTIGMVGHD